MNAAAENLAAGCPNHREVLAGLVPCARCGESYCSSCLIELRGRSVCAGCKDEEMRDLRSGVATGEQVWFSVSATKFAVMTICTLGFYTLYWIYQQWKLVRDRQNEAVSPLARTILAIFYIYGLLRRIRDSARAGGLEGGYSPGLFAILFIVGSMTWRLPGIFSMIAVVTNLALLPAVRTIEELRKADSPESSPNSRFSGWNIAGLAIGGPVLILAIAGNLMALTK